MEVNPAAVNTPLEHVPLESPAKWKRGFWMLFATQFQGALNEKGLQQLVIFIVLNMGVEQAKKGQLIIGSVFAIPYILFSMAGGYLADRYSKRSVTIFTKIFEFAVMILATVALGLQSLNLAYAAIFLASTQAALFAPSKYGLLPELLP